jgi:hypothetical protein
MNRFARTFMLASPDKQASQRGGHQLEELWMIGESIPASSNEPLVPFFGR